MQNNHSFQLSNYQTAVLTELGIIPWQIRSSNSESDVNSASKIQPDTNNSTKLNNPIQVLRETVKSDSPTAVADGNKDVVESLPEHIVIIFDDWNQSSQIAQDILSAMELDDKPFHIVESSEPKKQYADYALIWQQGDSIVLQNNVLTTPKLNLLEAPTTKRLLWQVLADYAG